MIKRIIFDLDDTLIPWKKEYNEAFNIAAEDYHLNIDLSLQNNFIESYEALHDNFDKLKMSIFFNKYFHTDKGIEFINKWQEYLGKMSEKDPMLNEYLMYLKKQYELAVLTNWFTRTQFEWLRNAGIVQNFQNIYGGEHYCKPNPKSYERAIGYYKKEECLMVGDSYIIDIKGALDIGMEAILLSKKQIPEVETIDSIYKLDKVLERRKK